ncbi:arsenate reductase family protein [Flavobacteriaceae bacterium]|nr:arsenate reductase family protein [Flavobacteriaceae bacterium]
MIKIYHNNRCRKSREGLLTLKEMGQEFEIIDYISNPLGVDELTELITILNIAPESLIRKSETIWKSDYKGKELSDKELIQAMAIHPKLIERPIVTREKKGVIGRPNEQIKSLFI